MCFGYCVVSSLLSAVLGLILLELVCGIGLVTTTLVLYGTTAELDYLI
uniref:Uncharacterized protein n=1 Tax=Siphoviridae sp. ctCVD13 TaxID=2826194 RepID=A0A8S5MFE8_9CAUD|nr:MAG TPA: hypothetical protein [Siphoviridae sp. ctCVD13]